MPTTTGGLRYPASGDAATVWQYIQNLASDVDTKTKITVADAAARTALTGLTTGVLVHETTTNRLWAKTAGGWQFIAGPPIGYSGTITAGSTTTAAEYTTSSVSVTDPGFTYRLIISAALVITQNVNDARADMRVYDGATLIMAATKSSGEINNQYSTELAARPYPLYGAAGLTGARTVTLRVARNLSGATTSVAVAADANINHFTIQQVPA